MGRDTSFPHGKGAPPTSGLPKGRALKERIDNKGRKRNIQMDATRPSSKHSTSPHSSCLNSLRPYEEATTQKTTGAVAIKCTYRDVHSHAELHKQASMNQGAAQANLNCGTVYHSSNLSHLVEDSELQVGDCWGIKITQKTTSIVDLWPKLQKVRLTAAKNREFEHVDNFWKHPELLLEINCTIMSPPLQNAVQVNDEETIHTCLIFPTVLYYIGWWKDLHVASSAILPTKNLLPAPLV